MSKRLLWTFETAKKTIDDDDKILFFGPIYGSCPEKFELQQGEKNLIMEIVACVKSKIESDGYQYYKRTKKPNWNSCVNCSVGRFFCGKVDPGPCRQLIQRTAETIKEDLFKMAQHLISTIDKNFALDINMINIMSKENKTSGNIPCIFCLKKIVVYYHMAAPYSYWVLSNYKKHVIRHQQTENKENVCSKFENEPGTGIAKIAADVSDAPRDDHILHVSNSIPTESIVELPIINIETFYGQISKQNLEMMNNSLQNNQKEEDVRFNIDSNTEASLRVVKITKDGNCLFSAFAHQMFYMPVNSVEHKKLTREFRSEVIKYLQKNMEKLDINHVFRFDCDFPDTDSFLSQLKKNGFWGGIESLEALSAIYETNVIIFNENGDFFLTPPFNLKFTRVVLLAYRCGPNGERNHYDSICQVKQTDLYSCASRLLSSYEKSLNLKSKSVIVIE